MDKPRILVITASTREGRAGEGVAKWIQRVAAERTDAEFVPVDLKDFPLPFYAHAKSPKMIETQYPDPTERRWVETVNGADGFLIVTPEYNHGYPAALKNALDYVYAGWNRKPVAFVSYGGSAGGVRSVQQLRQVAVELQLIPVRAEVNIPMVFRAFGPDGNPTEPFLTTLAQNTLNELVWWAGVLKEARAKNPFPAPVMSPKPR